MLKDIEQKRTADTNKKLTYLVNYETVGGIKQYFDEITSSNQLTSENIIPIDRPDKQTLNSLIDERVYFNGVSKQFFYYILIGGRPSLINHDPKLRLGFTLYELIYYVLLILLSSRIRGCIFHSRPSSIVGRLFKHKIVPMPHHDLKICSKIKILFFGRVEEYKAIHKYLDIFESNDRVKLIIAGRIRKNIKGYFAGLKNVEVYDCFFSDWMLKKLIQSADYILMPYDDITNTNIHLQAFMEKKPVIRTDLPYFQSNIAILKNLVFKCGDAEALRNILNIIPAQTEVAYKEMINEIDSYWSDICSQKNNNMRLIAEIMSDSEFDTY